MVTSIDLSQTYLFKISALKNMMDRAFDQVLQTYAYMTLSQFLLLLAISEHQASNQRTVAHLLGVSPATINHQVDIAMRHELLRLGEIPGSRGQALVLTSKGEKEIERGISVLEKHLFHIFKDENIQTGLMAHIELLLDIRKESSQSTQAGLSQTRSRAI